MKKVLRLALLSATVIMLSALLSVAAFAKQTPSEIKPSASNSSSGIKLKWTAVEDVSYYKVYRGAPDRKKKTLLTKTKSTAFTDEKAVSGTRYGYKIVPVMKDSASAVKSTEVFICRLSTPELQKATNTPEGISITWTATEGATSYRVYRRTEKDKQWKLLGKISPKTLSYTDTDVNDSDTYIYRVRAHCSADKSAMSNKLKADFLKTPKITKISSNKTSVGIRWTKVPKAVSYRIYRISSDSKGFKRYLTVKADTLTLTDKNVKRGVKYGYVIRAVDKNGKVSGHAATTYTVFMKIPKMKSATNTASGVKLTWSKSPSATGYVLYRRTVDGKKWTKVLTTKKLYATDKKAKNGEAYVYAVKAAWNKVLSPCYEKGITARFLSAPSGVKVEFKAGKGNTVSWNANSSATKYNVYKKAEGDTEWTRIAHTSKISYTDKAAKAGSTCLYFVRAYISNKCRSDVSKTVRSDGIDPKGKMVALTYDDGPSNSITPLVLDTLEKYGARATFFILGSRVNGNYKPMQRAVKLGCEIGNHTYNHINLPSYDKEKIQQEINATNNLVKKYTGVTPVLARAPGGSTDSYSRQAVGMPFIYWSVDTRDWETNHAPSIIAHVKNETRDGSIVLMHDLYEETAKATETIVPWLISEGYQLVTVSELMRYRGISLQSGVTYYNAYR